MTTKRERRAAKAAAKEMAKYTEAINQQMGAEARARATRQFIALKDCAEIRACPATGKPVDRTRQPAAITGPYFSKPYGFPGRRKRRKWTVRPVATKISPCLSVMWSSSEVAA